MNYIYNLLEIMASMGNVALLGLLSFGCYCVGRLFGNIGLVKENEGGSPIMGCVLFTVFMLLSFFFMLSGFALAMHIIDIETVIKAVTQEVK